jgi:hypothetical protein
MELSLNEMKPISTYQSFVLVQRICKQHCSGRPMPGILASYSMRDNSAKQTPEMKNPPVQRADNAQGDGGVDVTGAPKSRSVEGADFGQLFCLSSRLRSLWDRILPEVRASNCYTWGLQFLSRLVFAQVNARLL